MNDHQELPTIEEDLKGKHLTFTIDKMIYGVPLEHVIEILSIQAITHVPGVPSYIKGIINLRGNIVPVIDMRLKFNLEAQDYSERTCIIVIDVRETQAGLIVDQVNEVLSLAGDALENIPDFQDLNKDHYISSIGKHQDAMILNLDCERILSHDVQILR